MPKPGRRKRVGDGRGRVAAKQHMMASCLRMEAKLEVMKAKVEAMKAAKQQAEPEPEVDKTPRDDALNRLVVKFFWN